MRFTSCATAALTILGVAGVLALPARAQQNAQHVFVDPSAFHLSYFDDTAASQPAKKPKPAAEAGEYKEISDFFNVREANSSVDKGEWELEFEVEWQTRSCHDDDLFLTPSLKYGVTDTLFLELEVLPINIGDGGDQGNGDLAFVIFNQFLKEAEWIPAFAMWAEMRIPSGEGSSGVDAEFHFNLTKTLLPKFRAHLEGFVETANGGRGDEDIDRRNFQWGIGPGFDYEIDDKTIAALNYLMRSSEEEGRHNTNVLELGIAREIVENQHLKFAIDIGLDGQEETPNFAAKLLWSIEWK